MRPIKYNPNTEPLALFVEEILEGREVEIPVRDKSEGLYIRDRLTGIFRSLQDEFRRKTYTEWPRPIPHLIKEKWISGEVWGEWKVKVDWKSQRNTRKVFLTSEASGSPESEVGASGTEEKRKRQEEERKRRESRFNARIKDLCEEKKRKRQKKEERKRGESWFNARKTIEDLYEMDPFEFEKFVAELYAKLGYSTNRTKSSGDEGIDVIACKDNKKFVIQVKRTRDMSGSPVMQKLYGSMAHVLADGAICVSLAGFTTAARRFASGKAIELIDGNDLVRLIEESEEE